MLVGSALLVHLICFVRQADVVLFLPAVGGGEQARQTGVTVNVLHIHLFIHFTCSILFACGFSFPFIRPFCFVAFHLQVDLISTTVHVFIFPYVYNLEVCMFFWVFFFSINNVYCERLFFMICIWMSLINPVSFGSRFSLFALSYIQAGQETCFRVTQRLHLLNITQSFDPPFCIHARKIIMAEGEAKIAHWSWFYRQLQSFSCSRSLQTAIKALQA